MKKFISLLLALVMVFSMGAMAFAADKEDASEAPETTVKHVVDLDAKLPIVNVSVKEVLELAKQIFTGVNLGQIKEALGTTIETLGQMVEALKPLFKDVKVDDIPAAMMDSFVNGLAKLFGTDRQGILDALMEIPLVKEIMGWYGYKDPTTALETTTEAPETTEAETEAPVEEVPNTGAAAGVAVFASLSVAAAAAFVSKKKAA